MRSRQRGHRAPNPSALPWPRTRRAVQVAALLLCLALLLATRGGAAPSLAPSLFFRLDPLVMLSAALAERQWIAALAPALLTLALTLVAGRVWCGWLCPLGTTLDLYHPGRGRRRPKQPPATWRVVKTLLLLAILGAALAGNLTLLVLDPISLLTRGLAAFLLPVLNVGLLAAERALYDVGALGGVVDWIEATVREPLFPVTAWRGWNVLPGLLLLAVVALNHVAPRFWCRYLCPLGGLLGALSRVAILRRRVDATVCGGCRLCERACPMGAIPPGTAFASDPAECTVCLDCLPECPQPRGQTFAPHWQPAPGAAYDPTRRQVLTTLAGSLAVALAYPLAPAALRRSATLLRPPGVHDPAFLAACVRCGLCLKVCPTAGLQPSLGEAGLAGLWTPTLVPRLGYCDYSCAACGQVCPTSAIPLLSLDVKRGQVIGLAEVDRVRCLAWGQDTPCIVCEEMCPQAPKAIELDTVVVVNAAGQSVRLQRPVVLPKRCIGCGICENKCPTEGAAAIRVHSAFA